MLHQLTVIPPCLHLICSMQKYDVPKPAYDKWASIGLQRGLPHHGFSMILTKRCAFQPCLVPRTAVATAWGQPCKHLNVDALECCTLEGLHLQNCRMQCTCALLDLGTLDQAQGPT